VLEPEIGELGFPEDPLDAEVAQQRHVLETATLPLRAGATVPGAGSTGR
jgi:hypothetical protein